MDLEHDAAIGLLRDLGAASTAHSGRTFLDHLRGTASLLGAWGASEPVVRAGLFHSVYGTRAFKRALAARGDRARIRSAIGGDAERLVFLFCGDARPADIRDVDLPRALSVRVRRTADPGDDVDAIVAALIEIECANLVEQGGFAGSRFRTRLASAVARGDLRVRDPLAALLDIAPISPTARFPPIPPTQTTQPTPPTPARACGWGPLYAGPLAIRAARPADKDTVLRMGRELLVSSRYARSWFDTRAASASFDRFSLQAGHAMLVAHLGDEPAGFVAAVLQPSLFNAERSAVVVGLYVRPWLAGVIGLRLLLQVRRWARSEGAQEMLAPSERGTGGVDTPRFYERIGLHASTTVHALWLK